MQENINMTKGYDLEKQKKVTCVEIYPEIRNSKNYSFAMHIK